MFRIYSLVWSLLLMELAVLLVCWFAVAFFLKSTFLRQLNIRQELRAKEYLFVINRNVCFQIRGLVDFAAMFLVFTTIVSHFPIISDLPPEKYCSEFSINDCQQYIQYMLVGLSSLAILDCFIVLCAVGRLTKTDIVSTLLGYYLPLSFFGLLYACSLSASKDEDVVTICYRQDHSAAISNQQGAGHRIFLHFNSFVFFFSLCALVHAAHSHLTRQAAEMVVSIFKDSKTEVAKDKADVLEPLNVTWIQTELDRESKTTTGLFSDDENIRMWRKYFLSRNKAEMCVPSHCESFCRFSPEQARLYLGLILYFACIVGVYYYTVNFFDNSELRNFTFLIFSTLLTINSVIRVAVVAAIEGLKEEAAYRKIYKKDIFECFRNMYHSLRG